MAFIDWAGFPRDLERDGVLSWQQDEPAPDEPDEDAQHEGQDRLFARGGYDTADESLPPITSQAEAWFGGDVAQMTDAIYGKIRD